MPAMRTLFITLALVGFGCGDDGGTTPIDAPVVVPPIDAPPVVANDCPTYCSTIAANCTGLNAQYGGTSAADVTAHCMSTCAAEFKTLGAVTDTTGATLGCHIYHAGTPSKTTPTTHCVHAGPAGGQVTDPGTCGDQCTNFCALEIGACGLMGASATGQYTDMAACVTACAGFDKTAAAKYVVNGGVSPTANPGGNSLACRLYHATNAAITGNTVVHCPHTQATPTGPCAGTIVTPM
jgi:hypothetical protein